MQQKVQKTCIDRLNPKIAMSTESQDRQLELEKAVAVLEGCLAAEDAGGLQHPGVSPVKHLPLKKRHSFDFQPVTDTWADRPPVSAGFHLEQNNRSSERQIGLNSHVHLSKLESKTKSLSLARDQRSAQLLVGSSDDKLQGPQDHLTPKPTTYSQTEVQQEVRWSMGSLSSQACEASLSSEGWIMSPVFNACITRLVFCDSRGRRASGQVRRVRELELGARSTEQHLTIWRMRSGLWPWFGGTHGEGAEAAEQQGLTLMVPCANNHLDMMICVSSRKARQRLGAQTSGATGGITKTSAEPQGGGSCAGGRVLAFRPGGLISDIAHDDFTQYMTQEIVLPTVQISKD
ncbi:hypothetical protein EGW08_017777 [Elysia chlorotica]|uniref:Uncharacterized protein n=1 Tax=Elysia chlorotica TaxID=188477 RepID=A0A3S1B2G4_ELYCH|nr:hypothetical protein EGW08_017777 [Elysia chlorotica]